MRRSGGCLSLSGHQDSPSLQQLQLLCSSCNSMDSLQWRSNISSELRSSASANTCPAGRGSDSGRLRLSEASDLAGGSHRWGVGVSCLLETLMKVSSERTRRCINYLVRFRHTAMPRPAKYANQRPIKLLWVMRRGGLLEGGGGRDGGDTCQNKVMTVIKTCQIHVHVLAAARRPAS